MDYVKVIYADLPPRVKGMFVKTFDEEECYTIVLNSRLSAEQNRKTYEHELKHIEARDFDQEDMTADEIEYVRHL